MKFILKWSSLLVMVMAAGMAAAQKFPERPLRMIVPLPPGSASDFLARTVGASLAEQYGQQFVVDNRPGAGGLIGSSILATSSRDGYTYAMVAPPHTVAPLLQKQPPYHPIRDFTAVIEVASIPNIIAVTPGLPARNLREFVALLKADPTKYNYASLGVGTLAHVGAEIFNLAAGVRTVHVPFKQVPEAFGETASGRVHYLVFTVPTISPVVRDGRLRPLAVTSAKRNPAFPNIPSVVEEGLPAAQSDGWFGILGPAGVSKKIVAQLAADVKKVISQPRIKEVFERQGATPSTDSGPEVFDKLMKEEYARYVKLIADVGIKPQ
ncbi:MAG: tripartite tricarboxylate transporter substrate-binding protein [Betaproteobacteria bacterium]|nr:tripartite tricarboxylate transporter substrate-binding protein [Betaproteobacteria bacterium]MDH4293710.1 tripartite tricarboxylate transporter substrate-binding protein [Betaproteobacteria bacterium]